MKRGIPCKRSNGVICKKGNSNKENLKAIATDYLKNHQRNSVIEHIFYGRIRNFDDALQKAATARLCNGKCHPHQYRIGISRMTDFAQELGS